MPARAAVIQELDTGSSANGVVSVPATMQASLRLRVDRYTKLFAPNGKALHLLAQSPVEDLQLVALREICSSLLTPKPELHNRLGLNSVALIIFPDAAARDGASPALASLTSPHTTLLGNDVPASGNVPDNVAAQLLAFFNRSSLIEPPDTVLSLAAWRRQHFGTAALRVPALESRLWGDRADPDRDRRTNLVEYMEGTNPNAEDTVPIEWKRVGTETFSLTWSLRRGDTGIEIVPQHSTDLLHWNPLPPSQWEFIEIAPPSSTEFEQRTYQFTFSGNSKSFVRFNYERN